MKKTDVLSCVKCSEQNKLVMVAHRNELGAIVGWVHACVECFEFVAGSRVQVVLARQYAEESPATAQNRDCRQCRLETSG
jgi:hypothetical protein